MMTTDVRGAPMATGRLAMILLHGRDQDPDRVVEHVGSPLVAELPDLPFTWPAPAALGRSWYAGRVHDPIPETLDERERAEHVLRRPRRWGAALIWTGTAFGPPGRPAWSSHGCGAATECRPFSSSVPTTRHWVGCRRPARWSSV